MKPSPDHLAPSLEDPAGDEQGWRWQLVLPSWLISFLLHALLILILGLVASQELHGTNAPPSADLIASTSVADESELFDDEQAVVVETASEPMTEEDLIEERPAGGAMSELIAEQPPVDVSSALPNATELAGIGQSDSGLATGAGDFTGGKRRPVALSGGKARTSVYGLEGEGHRFVYVFDRSASMGSGSNSPFASAKRELLKSLDNLGDTHQFQIIFYNERPTAMNIGRQYGGMLFADAQGKQRAQKYIASIMSEGGTQHGEALEEALKLSPDVIFFLTDADQPELSAERLARIKRRNSGRTSIHTIEFGLGARLSRDNFLAKIARQNGGKYVYIDISKRDALKLRADRN